ncbi:MAG: transcriptional repressor LexA [Candidatus Bipolaricaulota bacterium]|nr:transcriptional repressor LexA [Candidatus Bipolaricaulota bacterium]
MRVELTEKQRQILDFIVERVSEQGLPPTLREIAERFGLQSVRSAQTHLDALAKKGFIRRLAGKSRGIELVRERVRRPGIPIVGRISAGQPIPALEEIEGTLDLDVLFGKDERPFALRVQGDSMIEAGIFAGDLVIVQPRQTAEPGEIVVAVTDNEATVKFFAVVDGKPMLVPANARYAPAPLGEGQIVGRVVGVLRQVKRNIREIQRFLNQ